MEFLKLAHQDYAKKLNPPTGKIHLIIDSDAKNEVDDQFAIAWALQDKDRFIVDAVYAVPFAHSCFNQFNKDPDLVKTANSTNGHAQGPEDGMEQSFQEILKIFDLMSESAQGRVFRGSAEYLTSGDIPVESEAARDLVRRANASSEPLYVAAIGAATNIASALLMDPSIIHKIVVVWLGGNALAYGRGVEFNLIQDVKAAQVLFNSGVPLIWVPCMDVASLLSVSDAELRGRLLNTSKIGDYLAQTVLDAFQNPEADVAMMKLLRGSSLIGNNDQEEDYLNQFPTKEVAWSRIIWDIAAIAALKNPNWTPSILTPSPELKDDFTWSTARQDRHPIRMVTHCYRNMILGDLFAILSGKGQRFTP